MGIYDKRSSISRRELRDTLRISRNIPRTGGQKYTQRETEKMGKEVFSAKYGSNISRQDYRRALRGLERDRSQVKTNEEKKAIDKKLDYLKDLGGRNI